MRPNKSPQDRSEGELFLTELEPIINPEHELAQLAKLINWDKLYLHYQIVKNNLIYGKFYPITLEFLHIGISLYTLKLIPLSSELTVLRSGLVIMY